MKKLLPFFYGLADLGPSSIDIFLKVYLLLYFNVILGLSPTLTSTAIGLGVVWDALIDPWIGVVSDRYYQKHGHRKPLIFSAIFVSAILFFLLWRWPKSDQTSTFIFLLVVSALLNSAISFFSVPYIAVANDLIKDNEKRKPWTAWRMAFFNFGSFLGLMVPAYFLSAAAQDADTSQAYKSATLTLAAVMVLCSMLSIFMVYRGRVLKADHTQKNEPLKFRTLLADKEYLRMMMSYFVVNCGLGLNSALALYYYKDYLQFTEQQTHGILVGFLFVFTISIPVWVYLTRFYDKQNLIRISAFLLGVYTVVAFPNFKGASFAEVFGVAACLGGFLVGVAVVLEIYLSEFLRKKEELTGQNVSGQYLGIWKMAAKISRGVAIGLAGPVLEASKDPNVLAHYFGWGVGLFFILSAVVISIPIREEKK